MVNADRSVAVWDPLVRIFHWSVATLVLLNYWLLDDDPHEWVGYSVAALLTLRILWGFVGTHFVGAHNARFTTFFPTPARIRHHLQQLRVRRFDPHEGHNPLGALMILLMLLLLAMIAISGWMQGLDQYWGEDWVQNLHKYSADALMIAAAIHVAAVITMSRYSGLALIRPMIGGRRPLPPATKQ